MIGPEADIIRCWKIVCAETDECSSGPLKKLAHLWLNAVGRSRNYGCLCVQHDFDYRFGPRFGITRAEADTGLRNGIAAAGHPDIAAVVWFALRMGGWYAWYKWRRKGGA